MVADLHLAGGDVAEPAGILPRQAMDLRDLCKRKISIHLGAMARRWKSLQRQLHAGARHTDGVGKLFQGAARSYRSQAISLNLPMDNLELV